MNAIKQDSNLPSETVLRAKIIAKIMIEKNVSKDKIIDDMNNYFKVSIPSNYYDKIITEIVNNNDKIVLTGSSLSIKKITVDYVEDCDNDSIDSIDSDDEDEQIEPVTSTDTDELKEKKNPSSDMDITE